MTRRQYEAAWSSFGHHQFIGNFFFFLLKNEIIILWLLTENAGIFLVPKLITYFERSKWDTMHPKFYRGKKSIPFGSGCLQFPLPQYRCPLPNVLAFSLSRIDSKSVYQWWWCFVGQKLASGYFLSIPKLTPYIPYTHAYTQSLNIFYFRSNIRLLLVSIGPKQ